MGDRMTVRQAESVRLMIDSNRLVNRLQDHVNGEIELSVTQIQASKILLDKSLPSLQATDITAHSSPQIEDETTLVERLRALIARHPQLLSDIKAEDSVVSTQHAALLPADNGQ